jgi:hypothetical protein
VHLVDFIIRIYHDTRSSDVKFSDIPKEPDASLHRVEERSCMGCSFFSYLTDKCRPNAIVSFY